MHTCHLCTQSNTHTHTWVHSYLFVRMWLSWVQCAHMTASVKCEFGWQRKESLYLWNSKRLHATALRGENVKLACHSVVEISFPCVWRTGFIFKKNSTPLQFPWPLLYSSSSSFFFPLQHISAVEFSLLFGMKEFGGGGGAVSFSRVYRALQSGSISDFTQGKS